MEGVNLGGILLGFVSVLVLGGAAVLALGLLLARLYQAARLLFASGLLVAALIAAVAALSFLERECDREGEILIGVTALSLLLAGVGQFVAALRSPRLYPVALGFAASSLGYTVLAVLGGSDALRWTLPAGPWVSLVLAAASLVIAVFPARRESVALLWTAQALLGGIAGFTVGAACVTTRCTVLGPEARKDTLRVEVFLLGMQVSDETGNAIGAVGDPTSVRFLSLRQAAWVYGPAAVGAVAGLLAALGIATSLLRRSGEAVAVQPPAATDRPHGHAVPVEQAPPADAIRLSP